VKNPSVVSFISRAISFGRVFDGTAFLWCNRPFEGCSLWIGMQKRIDAIRSVQLTNESFSAIANRLTRFIEKNQNHLINELHRYCVSERVTISSVQNN